MDLWLLCLVWAVQRQRLTQCGLVLPLTLVRTQPCGFIGLAALVIAVTTRTHELADRHFWASLRTTARAYRMTAVAEQRGVEATTRKEAAEAQALAFQNVMRYVCHELRNPLHGIMVRPVYVRYVPVSLAPGLEVRADMGSCAASSCCVLCFGRRYQGLLEGVRGELDDAEDWVQEDVATVWNAATSMAVILNDVLDLGQVRLGRAGACGGPRVVVADWVPAAGLCALCHHSSNAGRCRWTRRPRTATRWWSGVC